MTIREIDSGGRSDLESAVPSELPAWAKRLLKRPLIEIRRGLSLGYDPPAENSSVLALTAPSGKYVDIRFSLLPASKSSIKSTSAKFNGYATAGLSIATIQPGTESCPPYECMIHVIWEHPIDSSEGFTSDGADMYLLSNGDVMEIGTMEINGKIQMFKEYWIEPKLDLEQLPYVVVELDGGDDNAGKGMVIRIGDYCQGIFQDAENLWLERWVTQEADGKWVKDSRSTTVSPEHDILPCQWVIETMREMGAEITIRGKTWKVTEASGQIAG